MSNIHKNLKQLREAKGLTQESVAQQIGLTRQAISSYESGRTQPGIDLLMRFAEIYGVELDVILYGRKERQNITKWIKIVAIAMTIIWLSANIIRGGLLLLSYTVFAIDPSAIDPSVFNTAEGMRIRSLHSQCLLGAEILKSVPRQTLFIGSLILLILDLCGREAISMRSKVIFWAALMAGTVCFAVIDPMESVFIYGINILSTGLRPTIFLCVDLIVSYFQKKRRQQIPS